MAHLRIGILGAESSGKSTLAAALAERLEGTCINEYAREYIGALQHPYTYEDVEKIAHKQIEQLRQNYTTHLVFYDTELIITKVWFLHKYGKYPQFVTDELTQNPLDFCLLCAPDLPFIDDPLRENPHLREYFFEWYKRELEELNTPYSIVQGTGEKRTQTAENHIRKIM
ncbi:MAG: ATP-binding protein [Paludibacter sp.]|nr:ATP-binding protein [Bacteroidales bacterium]MCM1069211.1 ATP-binding protein [Prevotella sp.]MCM1354116.1 ATP-binding protein [Bacteroides sp.]MCM1442911.1 ATP-binding protein [Muribaculum sp.]MCM1481766.1 ATP-binding protein [Paludibacter sp.]